MSSSHSRLTYGGTRSYASINVDNTAEDVRGPWKCSYSRPVLLVLGAISLAAMTFVMGLRMGARLHGGDTYEDQSFQPLSMQRDFAGWFLTDVHIDPFYNRAQASRGSCRDAACCERGRCTPFGVSEAYIPTLGCDPPIQLLDNALTTMKAIDPAVDFLLFAGDMPAHDLCDEAVLRLTQREVMRRFRLHFPTTPLLFSIGNNDLWPNSRNSLENMAAIYTILKEECPQCGLFQSAIERENRDTFLRAGYYYYRDSMLGVRILVLNAGLWSPRYNNSALVGSGDEQLSWMEGHLANAKANEEKVVILSHIPPGHVRQVQDWEANYLARYVIICTKFADLIQAQLYGHHSKEYLRSFNNEVGVLVSSGMTPMGGGSLQVPGTKDPVNPTFKYMMFGAKSLYDVWTFYLDLQAGTPDAGQRHQPQSNESSRSGSRKVASALERAQRHGWQLLYSFRAAYQVEDAAARSIASAARKILHTSSYASRYEALLTGCHSLTRLIACDVITAVGQSMEMERCEYRLCENDVSLTCLGRSS